MNNAKLTTICIALVAALCFSGCKPSEEPGPKTPREMSFSVGPVEMGETTRVSDNRSGSTHSFTWEIGDKIQLYAYKQPTAAGETKMVDLGVFTATTSGATATFSGKLPASIDASCTKLYAIYPAKSGVSAETTSREYNSSFFYKLFYEIPQNQTGSTMSGSYFTSTDGVFDPSSGEVTTPPSFKLSTPVMRFLLQTGKEVSRIYITATSAFAGTVSLWSTQAGIMSSGDKNIIILRNGAVIAPAGETTELAFASRQLAKNDLLTFEFHATDGSTASIIYTEPTGTSANHIYNMGTLSIPAEAWHNSSLPEEGETVAEAVPHMGLGVNLGGLDAITPSEGYPAPDRNDPISFETMSPRDPVNQLAINDFANVGFKCLRIPVTWFNHMDDPMSTIDEVWLDRIEEIVDWALEAGLYVIINMHHDTHSSLGWLEADYDNYAGLSAKLVNIWTQIALRFRDKDYRLLFESFNEISDIYGSWFSAVEAKSYTAVNMLNQDFVNAVRSTGGKNYYRNLVVSPYTSGTTTAILDPFVLPTDVAPGHIFVQVHSYRPIPFVTADLNRAVGTFDDTPGSADTEDIDEAFDIVKAELMDKGMYVVMGEYGSFPWKDGRVQVNNDDARCRHARYYTQKCLDYGIVPIYWYNPKDYRERDSVNWTYPYLKNALIAAYNDWIAEH